MKKPRRPQPPTRPRLAPAALGVDQVAQILSVHRSSIYRAVHDGTLRHVKFGARYLVPCSEVERLLGERLDLGPEGSRAS